MRMSDMACVAGIDGCRSGWVVVLRDPTSASMSTFIVSSVAQLLRFPLEISHIAIDIPIGLLDHAQRGGRECDMEARKLLGGKRASSVFPPPVRPALNKKSYVFANQANKKSSSLNIGLPKQAFAITNRIVDVDDIITPELQSKIFEVHPELCFLEMNEGEPLLHSKKSLHGRNERSRLLRKNGFEGLDSNAWALKGGHVQPDDLLDATAACWTAERLQGGIAKRIPDSPPVDSRGLRMEMWR